MSAENPTAWSRRVVVPNGGQRSLGDQRHLHVRGQGGGALDRYREHVAEINGIPPTGKKMVDAKIAETWEVWDTLGFLQQLGVIPAMS